MSSCFDKILNRNTIVTASYKVISDFESSSEKECSKVDSSNEKMYSKLLTQAQKAQDTIKHTGLSMNLEVPIPPRPSNRDRYILWLKRNVAKKVIHQTESVLYLNDNGYLYNEHYEAYQAIDLANEIKKTKGDSTELKAESNNFDNVYTKEDKNILRRRSVHAFNRELQIPHNNENKETQNIELDDTIDETVTSIQRRPTQRRSRTRTRTSLYGFDTHEFDGVNEYSNNNSNSSPSRNLNNVSFRNVDNTLTQYRQSVVAPEPQPDISNTPPPTLKPTHQNIQYDLEQQYYEPQLQTQEQHRMSSYHPPEQHRMSSYHPPEQHTTSSYCNIEHKNTLINDVKPSAPPASTNITFTKSNVQTKIDALSERC